MKITIPHMGNIFIAAKILFDGLDIDYVIPPPCNKEALRIGTLYSPEEICLPFKIMIGNYIQSIEKGADTVLLVGSCGPCRFGEYCELQMRLLKRLGYDLKFIVIDSPKDIGKKEFLKRIGMITENSLKDKREKINALYRAYKAICLIEEIEERAKLLNGYEKNKGECKNILKKCKRDVFSINNPSNAMKVLKEYKRKINNITIDTNNNPIKVAIIGEIYTVVEPFSNLYIEDKLMDYGVSIKRRLTPSWWVKDTILKTISLNSRDIKKASKNYLPFGIGGHARECIGEAVLAHEEGFDGAIQLFPMGCMPEIVSKAILPKVSTDKNFPIMSLIIDEMTGEAGYITRIEAFLDLLERRKNYCIT